MKPSLTKHVPRNHPPAARRHRFPPLVLVIPIVLLALLAAASSISASSLKIGIDPGHGGSDPGAVGPTGLTEKEINLETSLYLRDYVEANGDSAFMTRTTDVNPSLSDRSSYFNSIPVDRAISVHHNASSNNSANYTGVHVYLGMGDSTSGDLAYDVVHQLEDHLYIGFVSSNCSREGVHEDDFHMVRVPTMPAILCECSFVSNWAEEYRLYDPNYNRLTGWDIYAGLSDHYSRTYPGTPSNLRVINSSGDLVVSWSAASGATGYHVYRSTDGEEFPSDTLVTGTTVTFTDITPGQAYFFQVAAVNGTSPRSEGFPSQVLGAWTSGGATGVLVVDGVDRQHEEGGNTRNFIIQHGGSLANNGYAYDSASNEAVSGGTVGLTGYEVVDWILGEESTADETFSTTEQSMVQSYLNAGGKLFVSGAEIGWDLDHSGTSSDQAFYNNYLKADYAADDAGVYGVSGAAGTAFDGISSIGYDDGTNGPYDVAYPDCINPYGGGQVDMTYDGTGYNAGVQYSGTFKVVNLGFPFEALLTQADRDTVMARVMDFFAVTGDSIIEVIVDNSDPGCDTVCVWSVSTWGNNYGADKYWTYLGDGSCTATWTATIDSNAYYQVYFWVNSGAYADEAHYTIEHAGGSTDTVASQYNVGDGWHELGIFPFIGTATVTVSNESTATQGSSVVADAVRFLFHHALPPDEAPPAAVDDLQAALSVGDIALSWSTVTADTAGSPESVSYYVIYRSQDPASDGDSIAGPTESAYLDPGAAKDTLANYFYLVRAVDTSGNRSELSNRVGEFDAVLQTGP
jgi:N-acetylmuramoyl-L-alanine amidase